MENNATGLLIALGVSAAVADNVHLTASRETLLAAMWPECRGGAECVCSIERHANNEHCSARCFSVAAESNTITV